MQEMMKARNTAFALACALALAMPSIGMAQGLKLTGPDSAWYVGGGIGQSQVDVDLSGAQPGTSVDDKDTSFRVFGGYQFNKYFGVELGYSELGESKGNEPAPGVGAFTFEAKAWDLVAVGTLPLANNFSLVGKLGFYKGDLEYKDAVDSLSESNTDLTYAIGAQYDFSKNLGIRAEWQQYKSMGKKDTIGESDVDVFGVSVLYRFK
jgi:OOP family OmpA-OmpF porin